MAFVELYGKKIQRKKKHKLKSYILRVKLTTFVGATLGHHISFGSKKDHIAIFERMYKISKN
jgi:hypothetical protein